jgi:hypothetical protein
MDLPWRKLFFFFFIYVGCPGQLTRTTTIPHGPLDILQAQEQVRHREGDRRAHRGSNPERERNKSHDLPQQLNLQLRRKLFWLHKLMRIIIGYNCNNSMLFVLKKAYGIKTWYSTTSESPGKDIQCGRDGTISHDRFRVI